ncbi:hypothetical protein ACL2XP_12495 [Sodalis sp. RH21]|uniref:hypothetical protein n=1 Tax=unclassified Sodalis (in: enterobacteria) TaxID=2636512 RepID=UPI0039B488AA
MNITMLLKSLIAGAGAGYAITGAISFIIPAATATLAVILPILGSIGMVALYVRQEMAG